MLPLPSREGGWGLGYAPSARALLHDHRVGVELRFHGAVRVALRVRALEGVAVAPGLEARLVLPGGDDQELLARFMAQELEGHEARHPRHAARVAAKGAFEMRGVL